ncbi:MAG: 2-polyprenyl-3-methyl-6-methoxy-1,4-benzoquinone monooxygenase [Pseudomonadota bacterium]
MMSRHLNSIDRAIMAFDKLLKNKDKTEEQRYFRRYPAEEIPESSLSADERTHAAGLMRVNHAGEIAAQSLYKAQALVARDDSIRQEMHHSAQEELDHLYWCETRLKELNSHTSYLEPVWASGSFAIGLFAGLFGDKWNLGFLAETEHQVVEHLDEHLQKLPANDKKSRAILKQMKQDEASHAENAENAGANELPYPAKKMMANISLVMKKAAYYY